MKDEVQTEAQPEAVKPSKKAALKQYNITFHGEGGDIEIAHNFKLNVYKRNTPTTIDELYLGVLKNAVVHTFVKDESGKDRAVTIPMFSYTAEPV